MKKYLIKWRGTIDYYEVMAETKIKAMILFAQAQNLNPLLTMDRMEVARKNIYKYSIPLSQI